ncbi:MAG: class I SAM-dependent methyltransferase [Chloroflexota bacterium]
MPKQVPTITPLVPTGWDEYELLDSGEGEKLERYGPYTLARPEKAALWRKALPAKRWAAADAHFSQAAKGEGEWVLGRPLPERWALRWRDLAFYAKLTPFRHTGIFPEQAAHWLWLEQLLRRAGPGAHVLNLFGYTGIASLACAAAGATVAHLDASRPTIGWARDNAELAGLGQRPIRWLLDDALKFVQREGRRGSRYDGIIMDPPVFGRGPKGELWRFGESFPALLAACRPLLSERPLFVLVTAYATEDSSLTLHNLLQDWLGPRGGRLEAGELALLDGAGRALSLAIYARWASEEV